LFIKGLPRNFGKSSSSYHNKIHLAAVNNGGAFGTGRRIRNSAGLVSYCLRQFSQVLKKPFPLYEDGRKAYILKYAVGAAGSINFRRQNNPHIEIYGLNTLEIRRLRRRAGGVEN
jgi:hypothetical protein